MIKVRVTWCSCSLWRMLVKARDACQAPSVYVKARDACQAPSVCVKARDACQAPSVYVKARDACNLGLIDRSVVFVLSPSILFLKTPKIQGKSSLAL